MNFLRILLLSYPLSFSLYISAKIIKKVLDGRSLTKILSKLDKTIRPNIQALTFHAMRHLGWADFVANQLVSRYPNNLFKCLLLMSLTLLKKEKTEINTYSLIRPMYDIHTIVNESVKATQYHFMLKAYKSLLNANLRKFLNNHNIFLAYKTNLKALWNHQIWWIELLKTVYPMYWKDILISANDFPPLTLRVNERQISRDKVLKKFSQENIECMSIGKAGIIVKKPKPVRELPGFDFGWWSVQDIGAQIAAPLLNIKNGMRVLDACAAPGGKATHLLELADVDLFCVDIEENRLEYIKKNVDRLELNSKTVFLKTADVSKLNSWWDGKFFDAVLADVPCTGSGIVRRHPDIRWLRSADDLKRIAIQQELILNNLWKVVAPGGNLLYVTCSIFPEEGEYQILNFLRNHKDVICLDSPGQILPIRNNLFSDGFFYALLYKKIC
ncbi:MAG: 16S rRNA (cytosine(967)-C(5))-methyltransferase RsmB [Bordetella sp.]|nr:MAG: 16S rRNA (cytosine(967)-C(5))-methyltransferase RsmB [Bordetella sp.]